MIGRQDQTSSTPQPLFQLTRPIWSPFAAQQLPQGPYRCLMISGLAYQRARHSWVIWCCHHVAGLESSAAWRQHQMLMPSLRACCLCSSSFEISSKSMTAHDSEHQTLNVTASGLAGRSSRTPRNAFPCELLPATCCHLWEYVSRFSRAGPGWSSAGRVPPRGSVGSSRVVNQPLTSL